MDGTITEHGVFSWVDLVAHDMKAAGRWYAELFGWELRLADTHGGPPYGMFYKQGKCVAGIGQMSDEMKAGGVPPMWNNYVNVDDAQAIEKRARELGAAVAVPTMQVLDAGWLAFFQDPAGAHFGVWQANRHAGAELYNEPGSMSWNELATPDVGGAREFYAALFGWSYSEQNMGDFTYTTILVGDRQNGGIMPMLGEQWANIPPHWMAYFRVAELDKAVAQVKATGGSIKVPPTPTPVGPFSVVGDPQGAVFSLIEFTPQGAS